MLPSNRSPASIGLAAVHQSVLGIVKIPVVQRSPQKELIILRLSKSPCDLRHAPIVVAVLQRARGCLVSLIHWDVPKLLVIRQSGARLIGRMWFAVQPSPCRVTLRRRHRVLVNRGPCCVPIKAAKPLAHSLSDQ